MGSSQAGKAYQMKSSIVRRLVLAGLLFFASAAQAEHYTVPLLVPAGTSSEPQGMLRILNGTAESGTVETYAIDDAGTRSGPATFTLNASAAVQFAPAFLADCAERWKPATRRAHADGVRLHILPTFGNRRVDAVTAKDVRNWFDDLSATRAGRANRTLAVLSSMMKHAEALGLRREDSNPCKGLRRRKTGFEAHYLTDDEFAALGRALDGAEADHPAAVAALRFLLYTGARKSEALRLRWEHVHGDRAVLPDSKTGPRTIWLASPARAILAARSRRTNCPWVFASPGGGPAKLDKAWNAVRAVAGLRPLRIHDLRHSYAAVAVSGGEGLRVVAGLLGHADIKTTFGYAHLAEGSVFDAANRVSRGLADMLDGGEADHD